MTTKQHLTHLESTGLLRLAQTHPELEYLFRHALVQDAAYKSLLLADRKKLHRQVGETLERLYPNRIEDIAPMLGQHFNLAGNHRKALKYFTLGGDTDMKSYANAEAISKYSRALEIAKQIEATSDQLLYLYTQRGRALELSAQYEQALCNYEDMEALAGERNDQAMELVALMAQSTLYVTFTSVHNPDQGEMLLEASLALARQLDDQVAESKILWNLSNLYMFSGRGSAKSISYAERSLHLARQLELREQIAFTLNDVGLAYWVMCRVDKAKKALREASDFWRELDNLPMLADSLSTSSIIWTYAGEYEQAIAFAEEAHQISQSTDNLWGQSYSRHWVGLAHWELGQPNRAIAAMEESIRLGDLAGFMSSQVTVRTALANVFGRLGAIERGLETAHLALTAGELPLIRGYLLAVLAQLHLLDGNLAESEATLEQAKLDPSRAGHPLFFNHVILTAGELALKQGDHERTLTMTDEALADFRGFGLQMLVPHALYLKGQALLHLGQNDSARECLQDARSLAETLKSRWILWQILAALTQLETNPTEAEQLRGQAQEIIEYIAGHIPTEELRVSFLDLPHVRSLLESSENK